MASLSRLDGNWAHMIAISEDQSLSIARPQFDKFMKKYRGCKISDNQKQNKAVVRQNYESSFSGIAPIDLTKCRCICYHNDFIASNCLIERKSAMGPGCINTVAGLSRDAAMSLAGPLLSAFDQRWTSGLYALPQSALGLI